MSNYPKIGSKVTYARADEGGAVHTGIGQVKAVFVGTDLREKVQVLDGENAWNCDLSLINYTPEQLSAYEAAATEVQRLSDDGNKLVRETVAEYNAKVDGVWSSVLGQPLDLDAEIVAEAEKEEPIPETVDETQ